MSDRMKHFSAQSDITGKRDGTFFHFCLPREGKKFRICRPTCVIMLYFGVKKLISSIMGQSGYQNCRFATSNYCAHSVNDGGRLLLLIQFNAKLPIFAYFTMYWCIYQWSETWKQPDRKAAHLFFVLNPTNLSSAAASGWSWASSIKDAKK